MSPARVVVALVLLGALAACTGDGSAGTVSTTPAPPSSGQGRVSGNTVQQLQEGAASAAHQLASGDGLRVENRTGEPVTLVFPDGDTASVASGDAVTVLRPCPERLPLRAVTAAGEPVAEHDGPCRQRETWTLR